MEMKTAIHVAAEVGRSFEVVELLLNSYLADKLPTTLSCMLDDNLNNPLHCYVLGVTNKYHSGPNLNGYQQKILSAFLNIGDAADREKLEGNRNHYGYRPVDLIPALDESDTAAASQLKSIKSPFYRKCLDNEPAVSFEWVLVYHRSAKIEGMETQYLKVVKKARKVGLLSDLIPSATAPDKNVMVLVGCTLKNLRKHAEELEYEVPLLVSSRGATVKRRYNVAFDHLYRPFSSSDRLRIIRLKIEKDVCNVDEQMLTKILKRIYPIHDMTEVDQVQKLWIPRITVCSFFSCLACCGCPQKRVLPPFNFWSDLTQERSTLSFEHLSAAKQYLGEKHAFFFAWYSHYTAHLTSPALVGLFVVLHQLYQVHYVYDGSWEDGLRSPLVPLYCLFMSIWTTVQWELWKRKQSELAYQWDMMDADAHETVRSEFTGDECINTVTGNVSKYYPESKRRRKQCCSIPVVIVFLTLAAIAFIATKFSSYLLTPLGVEANGETEQQYVSLGATMASATVIVVLDSIYKKIAVRFTDWENHRYQSNYETSLVMKTFWFMFVNNIVPLMWTAFSYGNTSKPLFTLFRQTAIQIATKNGKNLVKGVIIPIVKFRKKLMKQRSALGLLKSHKKNNTIEVGSGELYDMIYADVEKAAASLNPDKLDNLDKTDVIVARMEALENNVKAPADQIVNDYAELVVQFAFVTLFANACALAPFVILIINIIGIRGEMYTKLYATQRPETMEASGIVKAWANILEIIGFMAILCNVCILIMTFDLNLGQVVMANVTRVVELPVPYENENMTSYTITTLENTSNDWWMYITGRERFIELSVVILLEHLLIMIKMGLSGCISDRPAWVESALQRNKWQIEQRQLVEGDAKTTCTSKVSESIECLDYTCSSTCPTSSMHSTAEGSVTNNQIQEIIHNNVQNTCTTNRMETSPEELRQIRKEFGAGSEEYMSAAKRMGLME
jgi:hypothetical protein